MFANLLAALAALAATLAAALAVLPPFSCRRSSRSLASLRSLALDPLGKPLRIELRQALLLRDVFAYSLRWGKNGPTLMALLQEAHLRAANLEADGRYDVRMRVPRTMQDFKGPNAALLALAASNLEAQQHASRRIHAAPLIDEVGESATLHAQTPPTKNTAPHRVEAGLRPGPSLQRVASPINWTRRCSGRSKRTRLRCSTTMSECQRPRRASCSKSVAAGMRVDGRRNLEPAALCAIAFGADGAAGSVQVRLGGTKVLATATAELIEPFPDRPTEGVLQFFVEFSPMAAPEFEPGRPSEAAVELMKLLERALRKSQAIDVESMCVVAGKHVWSVRVDICVLDHCGNLTDTGRPREPGVAEASAPALGASRGQRRRRRSERPSSRPGGADAAGLPSHAGGGLPRLLPRRCRLRRHPGRLVGGLCGRSHRSRSR